MYSRVPSLAVRIVQHEIQVIKMRHVVQPRGQIVEEIGQITVMRDRLGHLKKRLGARRRRLRSRFYGDVGHCQENSTGSFVAQ